MSTPLTHYARRPLNMCVGGFGRNALHVHTGRYHHVTMTSSQAQVDHEYISFVSNKV